MLHEIEEMWEDPEYDEKISSYTDVERMG